MKKNILYVSILMFSMVFFSCQKEESISPDKYEIEQIDNTSIKTSDSTNPIDETTGAKGTVACTEIILFTDNFTVSHLQYEQIRNKLINSGMSLVTPICNVHYYQNSTILPLEWAQRVDEALEIVSFTSTDVTLRLNNFVHVCYTCKQNPFCLENNSVTHVTLGSNGCDLGSFVLDVTSTQFVEIDLNPLIFLPGCSIMNCDGVGN